jgi:hypothetical protein
LSAHSIAVISAEIGRHATAEGSIADCLPIAGERTLKVAAFNLAKNESGRASHPIHS